MMKKLKNFSLSRLFKKKEKEYALYPKRDWLITFVFFFLLNVVVSISLILFYFNVRIEKDFASEPMSPQELAWMFFDRETFNEKIAEYDKKASVLEELIGENTENPSSTE